MTASPEVIEMAIANIEYLRDNRARLARYIRHYRSVRHLIGEHHLKCLVANTFAQFDPEDYMPLRRENLLMAARALRKFAQSELPGAPGCGGTYVGFDGYSYCGLADGHLAEREGAELMAQAYEYAADHLIRRTNKEVDAFWAEEEALNFAPPC
jgi:hypothetical protein